MKKDKDLNNLIIRQEEVLRTYEKWMNTIQDNHMISEYLFENHYYNIAIYGLGRIGKQLYKEMISSRVEVSYIIDQKYNSIVNQYYNQAPCYHPNDKLPITDLIIVTIPSEAGEIITDLKKKVVCPVKSINDILFVLG